ncbi:SelR-domain-containing protein [Hesseltinella vesiculosa]|uniref:SelR-domain-containing protein n=1 Tax=Hesseltinella vesiculosa TaxID=101127 RepID=A0A1X2GVD4_9FUNG|nr:SelR-domain-containing protein [Hesseltinella vesiculosa]
MLPALRPSCQRLVRSTITQRRWASTEHHGPEENFSTNAWRNFLIVVVGAAVWYRVDQRWTDQGEEKHPFQRYIEYHMTNREDKDRFAAEQLEKAEKMADYRLVYQEAQRAPIHRMRYPESFERASPRALSAGANSDVSQIQVSSASAWTLTDTYQGNTFFDGFTFFTENDPTHGTVKYVDRTTAQASGLIYAQNNVVTMKADATNVTPNGRPSVRISSNKTYNSGLFILDLSHMPTGCGTWPAYWLVGGNWPNQGEIDILEGVNTQIKNQVTLHTNAGCTMDPKTSHSTGKWLTNNCDINAPGQPANAGCSVESTSGFSYGPGLNAIQGGVYATQWKPDTGIQVWFFPRYRIPADITSGNPNPASWGNATADFPFNNCSSNHFTNMAITFDLTFCGDWAGAVYNSKFNCPGNCNDFVANQPWAFSQAYWKINSLKVYQSLTSIPLQRQFHKAIITMKTEQEWQAILTPEQFRILRQKGTEMPGTGEYNNHFDQGVYACAGCGAPLYTSGTKMNTQCGWPAFFDAVPGAVVRQEDSSLGRQRTEILCAKCGGHLGHVFKGEGFPTPTDERHCVNSISIRFNKEQ